MRRLERSCEEHDSPCVIRESIQRTGRSRRRSHPYQEDRINIFQAPIKSLGNRGIPAHHLDLWRQTGRIRVAGHRAEPISRRPQLIDNLATDVPGAADDEDTVHEEPSYRRDGGDFWGRTAGHVAMFFGVVMRPTIMGVLQGSTARRNFSHIWQNRLASHASFALATVSCCAALAELKA